MRLLVATTNRDKVREIREILAGLDVTLLALDDVPPIEAPEEIGQTFEDNARLKALHYAAGTDCLVVAEDSGLEIDALGARPGVESARYGGVRTPYAEKFRLLYAEGAAGSTARFVCALALAQGDHVIFEASGVVQGRIAAMPAGEGGFGYDPIFFYPPFGQTLAQAAARKSEVSHRAEAFRALRRFLEGGGGLGERGGGGDGGRG
jgi:XTP/dITP diphosphohydrolase